MNEEREIELLYKALYREQFKQVVLILINILLVMMLLCLWSAEAFSQTSLAGDLKIIGRAPTAPATIDVYIDGAHIDRFQVSQRDFVYNHAPFGKGLRQVKVVSRIGDGNPITLLTTTYNGSCHSFPLSPDAAKHYWCRDVVDYWKTRQTKAKHLFFPAIKAVINNSIGGTITELYGADRSYNLISEHGGAAIQLSLWGRTGDLTIQNGKYGYPCQPLDSKNGPDMHKVLNPIQASTKNCWYENIPATYEDEGKTNDISSGVSCGDKCWQITKIRPYNFTRSRRLPGMWWQQSVQLFAEGYARIAYTIKYDGVSLQHHPQEVPGMFWSLGANPKLFWFGYKEPYKHTPEYWSEVLPDTELVSLSNALNAYTPVKRVTAVPWWSLCSANEERCVTIVYPNQPGLRQINFERGEVGSWYASAMGYFNLFSGYTGNFRLYVFPVKHTQVDPTLLSNLINNG